MPDLSRLNQLLLLLEEGSSSLIREAAAKHLGSLVCNEPHLLSHAIEKLGDLLLAEDQTTWERRSAGAMALSAILKACSNSHGSATVQALPHTTLLSLHFLRLEQLEEGEGSALPVLISSIQPLMATADPNKTKDTLEATLLEAEAVLPPLIQGWRGGDQSNGISIGRHDDNKEQAGRNSSSAEISKPFRQFELTKPSQLSCSFPHCLLLDSKTSKGQNSSSSRSIASTAALNLSGAAATDISSRTVCMASSKAPKTRDSEPRQSDLTAMTPKPKPAKVSARMRNRMKRMAKAEMRHKGSAKRAARSSGTALSSSQAHCRSAAPKGVAMETYKTGPVLSFPQSAASDPSRRQSGDLPPLVQLWLRCLDHIPASRWQVRHGAALGLRALVLHSLPLLDALSPAPHNALRTPSEDSGRRHHSLTQALLVEAYLRGLLVLLLDVFVDYGSGQDAQYPVREVVAQACAASLRALAPLTVPLPDPSLPPPSRPPFQNAAPAYPPNHLYTRLCSLPLSLFRDGGGSRRAHPEELRVSILLFVKYALALPLPLFLSLSSPPSSQEKQHTLLHDVAELLRSALEWPLARVMGASEKGTGGDQEHPSSALLPEEQIGLTGECLCLLFRHPSFQSLNRAALPRVPLSLSKGSRAGCPSTRPLEPLSMWLQERSQQIWLLLQELHPLSGAASKLLGVLRALHCPRPGQLGLLPLPASSSPSSGVSSAPSPPASPLTVAASMARTRQLLPFLSHALLSVRQASASLLCSLLSTVVPPPSSSLDPSPPGPDAPGRRGLTLRLLFGLAQALLSSSVRAADSTLAATLEQAWQQVAALVAAAPPASAPLGPSTNPAALSPAHCARIDSLGEEEEWKEEELEMDWATLAKLARLAALWISATTPSFQLTPINSRPPLCPPASVLSLLPLLVQRGAPRPCPHAPGPTYTSLCPACPSAPTSAPTSALLVGYELLLCLLDQGRGDLTSALFSLCPLASTVDAHADTRTPPTRTEAPPLAPSAAEGQYPAEKKRDWGGRGRSSRSNIGTLGSQGDKHRRVGELAAGLSAAVVLGLGRNWRRCERSGLRALIRALVRAGQGGAVLGAMAAKHWLGRVAAAVARWLYQLYEEEKEGGESEEIGLGGNEARGGLSEGGGAGVPRGSVIASDWTRQSLIVTLLEALVTASRARPASSAPSAPTATDIGASSLSVVALETEARKFQLEAARASSGRVL